MFCYTETCFNSILSTLKIFISVLLWMMFSLKMMVNLSEAGFGKTLK